ncbi:MAG: hypothetical protein JSU81_09205 [Candidatus Coatesbacteria bacterium]|nr:MAG: hypothetical protein JSU81_09205 [Candidatus Coatesbacteria bacterium]
MTSPKTLGFWPLVAIGVGGLVGAALLIEAAYRWGKGREIKLGPPGE